MVIQIFFAMVRGIVVPASAIVFVHRIFTDLQTAFLGVNIVYSIVTIPVIVWHIIQILPNLALLRGKQVLKLGAEVIVEILSLAGFWAVYILWFGLS